MSHFTVTVRLTKERLKEHHYNLESVLGEILEPYNEQPEDGSEFLSFEDTEDENLEEYNTGSTEKVRTPSGELVWSHDERFRKPGAWGIGSDTHAVPAGHTLVEISFRELYPSFDAYMADYCGSSGRDKKHNRYGHWHNENAKWDWYTIGGRWTGFYPVKEGTKIFLGKPGVFDNKPDPGRSDVVFVGDIDMDKVAQESQKRLNEFWDRWVKWLDDPGSCTDPFDGPRRKAIDLGLITVEKKTVASTATTVAIPWSSAFKVNDERRTWTDVAKIITKEDLVREYADHFNPIVTYAYLDDSGWHAPGDMGWWGCSSDTPATKHRFAHEFMDNAIRKAHPEDLLVVVDCHI